jgi:hypothetical protein
VVTTNQLGLSLELKRSLQAYKSCVFLQSEKYTELLNHNGNSKRQNKEQKELSTYMITYLEAPNTSIHSQNQAWRWPYHRLTFIAIKSIFQKKWFIHLFIKLVVWNRLLLCQDIQHINLPWIHLPRFNIYANRINKEVDVHIKRDSYSQTSKEKDITSKRNRKEGRINQHLIQNKEDRW